ncbi:MAG: histidine phosphatase family protein [Burkholderiales bacterium]
MPFDIDRAFTFYFVRHGVTDLNFRGLRCGGDMDIPLKDLGCDQAYLLGKQIAQLGLGIERIVASDLIRTRQTALIMSGVLGGIPVETEPLLNERHLGEWNGKPIAENEQMLKDGMTPPGGESEAEFTARITRALEELRPKLASRILLVSSRGVGRIVNSVMGGEGRLAVANGEVVEFSGVPAPQGGFRLRVHRPHQVG